MTEMLRADGRSGTGMTEMLQGLMQNDFQLTANHIRRRMRTCNLASEVVTLNEDGSVRRISHGALSDRVDRLARALASLGIKQGDRVGTFAWNNQEHLELYFAVPCTGAVLHTLNIRLFAEQLIYIINHAEDRVIFVDASLVPVLEKLAPGSRDRGAVRRDGRTASRPASCPTRSRYEELLRAGRTGHVRLPRARRAPGCSAVLHERDDREPEGGALLAPLDQPSFLGVADGRCQRALARGPRARGRADVPRERLGTALRRRARGRRSDPPGPLPRRRAPREPDRAASGRRRWAACRRSSPTCCATRTSTRRSTSPR